MDDICKDKTKCTHNECWPDCKESCPNITNKEIKEQNEKLNKEIEILKLNQADDFYKDDKGIWQNREEQ